MTRAVLVSLLAIPLVACGDDASEDGGGGRAPTWVDTPDGRTLDASACTATADVPEPIRCAGEPTGPRVAVGVCGELDANNTLDVAPRTEREGDTHLAVDGATTIAAPLHVGGRWVALGVVTANNTTDVAGTFEVAQAWNVSSPAHVGGDAFVAAEIETSNAITIDGTIHTPFPENVALVTATSSDVGEVSVTSAIACDEAVDVAALVASLLAEPGTAASDRLPSDLLANIDEPSTLELGCASYVISSIGADNTFDLEVTGNAVVAIAGDLRIAAPMTIRVAPDATLDLAIGGNLHVDNTLTIEAQGDPTSVWIGVAGEVRVAAPLVMDGVLVAPRSDLSANNTVTVDGALLVGNLRIAAPVKVNDGAWLSGAGCVGAP
jgi:hypothetical protein